MELYYSIKVYNGSDAIVYNDIIKATSENDALIQFLKNTATIYDGDTIKIELSKNN